jgi:nucleotide-binding universal stress UspA family protein
MKNILVPFDFSDEAKNALGAAQTLARKSGAAITLLHVIEDPNVNLIKVTGEAHFDPIDALFVKKYREVVIEKLDKLTRDVSFDEIKISYKIDLDNAFSSISKHIAAHESNLIVMGTKGATGLGEVLVGSVTEKTVRYAKCPVIVVKGKADLSNIKSIIYATDLKEDQSQIIEELKEFQKFFGATLHLVKVFNSNWTTLGEVKERVKQFVERFEIENYTIAIQRESDFSEAIMDYATEIDADMIAIGTHDRHGLFHLLAAHVAKNVINHSRRPIWSMAIR